MRERIFSDITETIGNTPLVRLNRVVRDNGVEVLLKQESFNPLSSVKDGRGDSGRHFVRNDRLGGTGNREEAQEGQRS